MLIQVFCPFSRNLAVFLFLIDLWELFKYSGYVFFQTYYLEIFSLHSWHGYLQMNSSSYCPISMRSKLLMFPFMLHVRNLCLSQIKVLFYVIFEYFIVLVSHLYLKSTGVNLHEQGVAAVLIPFPMEMFSWLILLTLDLFSLWFYFQPSPLLHHSPMLILKFFLSALHLNSLQEGLLESLRIEPVIWAEFRYQTGSLLTVVAKEPQ